MWIGAIVLLLSFGLVGCKSGPKVTTDTATKVTADTAAIVNKKEIKLAEVE